MDYSGIMSQLNPVTFDSRIHADRVRRNKEASNKKFSKPVTSPFDGRARVAKDHKKKTTRIAGPSSAHPPTPTVVIDDSLSLLSHTSGSPSPVAVTEYTTHYYRNCTGEGPYFDGSGYLYDVPDHTLVDKLDTPRMVHKTFHGGFVLSTDPSENKKIEDYTPCLERVTILGYNRYDMNNKLYAVPPQEYIVATPLLRLLQTRVPDKSLSAHTLSACFALSVKNMPVKYRTLSDDTVQYYGSYLHRIDSVPNGETSISMKVANNAEHVGYGDFGRINTIISTIQCYNTYAPLVIDDEECDLPPYTCREDFTITVGTEKLRRPPTLRGFNPKTRHRTAFCGLRGRDQDHFIEYSNSANNFNHAGKRMFGARDNEIEFRHHASRLSAAMVSEAALACPTRFGDISRMERELRGSRVLDTDSTPTHRYIAEKLVMLAQKCNRGLLQKTVDGLSNKTSWIYYTIYEQILELPFLNRSQWAAANIPHVKRKLRQTYVRGIRIGTPDDILVNKLQACLKREPAKYGKAPRLFVSYGAGAMYANELPEFVKMCIDGLHVLHQGEKTMIVWIMAKPKSNDLMDIFTKLYEALSLPNYMFVCIFSDDACYAGCDKGEFGWKAFCYNVDVKSNDSSQDLPAFLAVYIALSGFSKSRAKGLLRQCMLPITCINPEDKDDRFTVKFDGPFEGSGTTLTTILNHFGSYAIAVAVFHLWSTGTPIEDAIPMGAKYVGHEVTFASCAMDGDIVFEKVQFLKRSPINCAGKWVPQLNIGCILRSFGTVEDDLDHIKMGVTPLEFRSMSMQDRMDKFLTSVVQGLKNEPGSPILTALRERFSTPHTCEVHQDLYKIVEPHDYSHHQDVSMNRYGLTSDEVAEMVECISRLTVGSFYSTTGFAKIYHMDYEVALNA